MVVNADVELSALAMVEDEIDIRAKFRERHYNKRAIFIFLHTRKELFQVTMPDAASLRSPKRLSQTLASTNSRPEGTADWAAHPS